MTSVLQDYVHFSWNSKHPYLSSIDIPGIDDNALVEMGKKVKHWIDSDDKANLEDFVTKNKNVKFSNYVFVYCCEKLSSVCFDYFYSLITTADRKREDAFFKLCSNMALQGKNFDGRDLWVNSGKRNARTPPPPKYKQERECIVPEECFYVVLNAGSVLNNTSKAKDMLKSLMMKNIPIGDNIYYTLNEDKSIQGYVSMLHSYLYQRAFNMYASQKKQNKKQELKGN